MTETLLLALPLLMIAAAVLQIFLIDEHVFRLATRAHHELFTVVAFPSNRFNAGYGTPTVRWTGPERQVPVVGFFAPYGLSAGVLRIRSQARTGDKRVMIGRGTAASLAPDGGMDMDVLVNNSYAESAMTQLGQARALRIEHDSRRPGGR